MKAKTAFESGNSPPKVSESGAVIETGRGLEQVKQRILRAFEQVHGGQPAPEKKPQIYTTEHEGRFHKRAKHLMRSAALQALQNSYIAKATRSNVFEITVPTETPEELYKAALGGDE